MLFLSFTSLEICIISEANVKDVVVHLMPPSLTHLTQRKISQQDLAQFKITKRE